MGYIHVGFNTLHNLHPSHLILLNLHHQWSPMIYTLLFLKDVYSDLFGLLTLIDESHDHRSEKCLHLGCHGDKVSTIR